MTQPSSITTQLLAGQQFSSGPLSPIQTPVNSPVQAPIETPLTVEGAIANAAQRTSIDFDFLIAQAQVESSMNPNARARTSSAEGLYQFIESTWLETMQRHGDRFGLGGAAQQISSNGRGRAEVADPAMRKAILAMRSDPQVASFMAAGLAEDNRAHLAPILGRQPDHGELYLAHFLGAGGAGRFLSAMADNPDQSAASLFRRPAAANRAIFYEPGGSPRSLAGVMDMLDAKLDRAVQQAGNSRAGAAGSQPAPYIVADAAAFAPLNPPAITGRSPRPYSAPLSAPASARPHSGPPQTAPLSNVLRDTFGAGSGGGAGTNQSAAKIERAYNQLRAFGL